MRKQYQNNFRSSTGLKGVYRKKKADKTWKYIAMIRDGAKILYLGTYKTEKEASNAYNKKALEIRGPHAVLNN